MNTVNLDLGDDAIATGEGLAAWCREFGLDPGVVEDADVVAGIALREALRGLVRSAIGHPVSRTDLRTIEAASGGGQTRILLDAWPSTAVAPRGPGIAHVLALLVAIVHEARVAGHLDRLRVCGNDGCRRAFYDRSRNLSATWCSMTICGNRRKVSAYRGRRVAARP